ncbi:MAG TPA: alpha/beta fold hydrolase, partial [Candidatus Saccharimonadales bacterium]|nr:alpha/beta fold hydrolase [Candidatus Saccharimonadales bacterium]
PRSAPSNSVKLTNIQLSASFSIAQIEQSNRSFYPASSLLPVSHAVDKYTFCYNSTDQTGRTIPITAQFFVPKAEAGERPLYVFGQGTTGLGDNCAPSKENVAAASWGNYQAHMLSYAAQGYIVMFPDYEGFNDPARLHHYFNAELEARVLLDGARAAYAFFDTQSATVAPAQAVFFAGYSQGGHAAFAAADLHQSYAPELPVKGVISYAGTTNMVNLLKENAPLAPYLAQAYRDFYGPQAVDPAQLFTPAVLTNFVADVTSICIDRIYRRYGYDARAIYAPPFYDALYNNKLAQRYPAFKKVLDQNNSGLSKSTVPALILQGSTDTVVTVASQTDFLRQRCAAGAHANYTEYPGVNHYQTRQVSFKDSLSWMQAVQAGDVPASACASQARP